jgi:hypothetical protein
MQDSERLSKGPLDYQVLIAFTDPASGAKMRVGDKISMDEASGSNLCRRGYLKDVTARIADTVTERVEDLETASASHASRLTATEAVANAAVTDAELDAAEERITTLEENYADHEERIDVLEAVISDNELTTEGA